MTFSIGKHILWSGHHVVKFEKKNNDLSCFLLHTQEIFRVAQPTQNRPKKLWKLDTKKRPGGTEIFFLRRTNEKRIAPETNSDSIRDQISCPFFGKEVTISAI